MTEQHKTSSTKVFVPLVILAAVVAIGWMWMGKQDAAAPDAQQASISAPATEEATPMTTPEQLNASSPAAGEVAAPAADVPAVSTPATEATPVSTTETVTMPATAPTETMAPAVDGAVKAVTETVPAVTAPAVEAPKVEVPAVPAVPAVETPAVPATPATH